MSVYAVFFFFQAEDGIRDLVRSRGLGDVYKRQVQGKSYDSEDLIGKIIWQRVEKLLEKYLYTKSDDEGKSQFILEEPSSPTYGNSILTLSLIHI